MVVFLTLLGVLGLLGAALGVYAGIVGTGTDIKLIMGGVYLTAACAGFGLGRLVELSEQNLAVTKKLRDEAIEKNIGLGQ